jgi:FAD/FMN-containing dehydrogenase
MAIATVSLPVERKPNDVALASWGRYPRQTAQVRPWFWSDEAPPWGEGRSLAYGLGRSYGDSCLNEGGVLVPTRNLSHFISFDPASGELTCEAGVTLDEILQFAVPRGWFLPTMPGTKFVTLGGAIANDIHGKNHHRAGTFGRHVAWLELVRSDGQRLHCSEKSEPEFLRATIGGLGLTGFIAQAAIQLRPITSASMDVVSTRFANLEEFFELSTAADKDFEYTVAWVDSLARGKNLGRGIFMAGNHAAGTGPEDLRVHRASRARLPFDLPGFVLNRWSVGLFNQCYFRKQRPGERRTRAHYDPFFFPLDALRDWNRLYGRRGFFQYQSVVPLPDGHAVTAAMLERISRSGQVSFLAVLKLFGSVVSPGIMSFPRPGVTLALDFPNRGEETERLFADLDAIVREAGGSLYPAKDARMRGEDFRRFYPQWEAFTRFLDPHCSSSFWRRVTASA